MTEAQDSRAVCPITRTGKRFLLRSLEFSQQYAPMYRCRMEAQHGLALANIQQAVRREFPKVKPTTCRVLELATGVPSLSVGVVYKQMKLLPRFLDEYQKELVRIDAGDEDGEDGGLEDVVDNNREEIAAPEADDSADATERAATDEHYNVCAEDDEVLLEDSSGRVVLEGVNANLFCTGVVVGVYGALEASGKLKVERVCFCGLRQCYVPRPLVPAATRATPCYVAFVCGLNVNTVDAGKPESVRARTFLGLLIDFICGNVTDPALLEKSRHISRLVIGGNSIAPTEELKLKKKVKLDPSDHAKMSGDKGSTVVTSASLMRELDGVLAQLASSVEVELMPGDNDMSDAFQPQQPLHPVLLPTASRYSSLRLVTNPFEFTASPTAAATEAQGPIMFVSSGQGINDVGRETRFPTRLGTLSMVAHSACACPTAPNTLFSYPFREEDPFVFTRAPHCFVACDQPCFETRFATLDELDAAETMFVGAGSAKVAAVSSPEDEEASSASETVTDPGVRLVCVPSFERTGAVVLVDVHSPSLATSVVYFKMK